MSDPVFLVAAQHVARACAPMLACFDRVLRSVLRNPIPVRSILDFPDVVLPFTKPCRIALVPVSFLHALQYTHFSTRAPARV